MEKFSKIEKKLSESLLFLARWLYYSIIRVSIAKSKNLSCNPAAEIAYAEHKKHIPAKKENYLKYYIEKYISY